MAACPPKSIHFQGAVGHTIGLPFSWLLLLGKQKKQLAHLLESYYEGMRALVCEIMFSQELFTIQKNADLRNMDHADNQNEESIPNNSRYQ